MGCVFRVLRSRERAEEPAVVAVSEKAKARAVRWSFIKVWRALDTLDTVDTAVTAFVLLKYRKTLDTLDTLSPGAGRWCLGWACLRS